MGFKEKSNCIKDSVYIDDGISDTTFEREGFQKLIAEVEAGNVATVIVKDMSRLGRNYLKVGFYTDIMFPEKGVDVSAIARQLTDEHVLIPPAHAAKSCSENDHSKGFTSPYTWSTTAVCYILEKQE